MKSVTPLNRVTMVPRNTSRALFASLSIYFIASFVHFAHNAEYLHAYPNMPEWLTQHGVYMAWLAITAVGLMGYVAYRWIAPRVGLAVWVVYAALGYAGLDHYVLAPVSAHTKAMNATIAFEVAAATMLLAALLYCWLSYWRSGARLKRELQ
jgi:type IV secretory pathway TrbD component